MRSLFIILFSLCANVIFSQEVVTDKEGFMTFEIQEADTSYLMKQYVLCLLKKGDTRDQSEEEAAKIQMGHMAHMEGLAKENKIHIAGPLGDNGDIQGIVIYNVPSVEEAKRLTEMDPAVKAGRLICELHPFWAAKGSKLD